MCCIVCNISLISCNWGWLRCWASPSAPLPGGRGGCTPTCCACFVIIKKTRTRSTLVSCSLLVSINNSITKWTCWNLHNIIPLGTSVSLMSIHKYCHIFNSHIFDSFVCKIVYSDWYTRVHYLDTCSGYKSWTCKNITIRRILSPMRLPISPIRLKPII